MNKYLQYTLIVVFLLPISVLVGNVGVSANYTFLLLLLFARPVEYDKWPYLIKGMVVYSVVCYLLVAFFLNDVDSDFYARQLISFLIFLGALMIAVVRMPFNFHVLAHATVGISFAYAIIVIFALIASGTPISNAGMVKAALAVWIPDWPQRYIVVVILGFFLALSLSFKSKLWIFATGLCGFCIAFSFVRAAWLSMLIAIALLFLLYYFRHDWASLKRLLYALIVTIVMVTLFLLFQNGGPDLAASELKRIHVTQAFISEIPITHDLKPTLKGATQDIDDIYAHGGEASGLIRIHIWNSLVNTMIEKHMWLGSGFLGPYFFDKAIGSAHSQYIDIFFRTGPIGLCIYLALWGWLVLRCFKHSAELGCGMVAWFIYGFFHETTKYSYVAFLFSCFLSMAWTGWENGKANK
jgi:hypothetical protein